jgi:hypothetical protein
MAVDRVQNVRFVRCLSINARHSAYAVGNYAANSTKSRLVTFTQCTARASTWNTYARGFGVGASEDSVVFDQCTFDGMNVRSQPGGSILISNCVFKNARGYIRDLPDTDGHISVESYISDNGTTTIGNDRYIYVQPTNIRIENCSFGPSPGPAIDMLAYYANPLVGTLPFAQIAAGTVTLRNNLFLDMHPKRIGKPFVQMRGEGPLVVGDQTFENNAIYRGGAVPDVVYATGPSGSPVTTTYTVNTAPGFTTTMTIDPQVDSQLRPKRGSPLLSANTRNINGRPDATGRQRKVSTTIGAYESFTDYNRSTRST